MNKNKDPGFDPQPEPTFNEKIFFQLQVQRLQHNGRTLDSYTQDQGFESHRWTDKRPRKVF